MFAKYRVLWFLMVIAVLPILMACGARQASTATGEGSLYRITVDGKYGYIDRTGKIIVAPKYDVSHDFSEGLAVVGMKITDGKAASIQYGYIDTSGKEVIPLQFPFACSFSDGLAAVRIDGKWGFINKTGQLTIKPVFQHAESFYDGRALAVDSEGKKGFINKAGEYVYSGDVGFMSHFGTIRYSDGLAAVRMGKNWGYIDLEGQTVILPTYTAAGYFSEGLAPVEISGSGFGYIDKKGEMIIQPQFDDAGVFSEGAAFVGVGKDEVTRKWGVIDRQGNFIIPPTFNSVAVVTVSDANEITRFVDGRARGRWNAPEPTPQNYRRLMKDPSQNTAYGYIDVTGQIVIEPGYVAAEHFHDGIARVFLKNNITCYIDKAGKVIWQAKDK